MSETVYIETSVIGYLTARSTQNLVIAGNIETTRDWWQNRRNDFVLYISATQYGLNALDALQISSADFASWLLGEPVTLTELKPSELSLDPIRADAMILLQSDESILHIEFQTLPKENIPFRMLDYRVRGHRRYKEKTMRQVVIYLKSTTSELVYQTSYVLERTRHEFDVIRLWEHPASLFLQYPGLLPFAALGQSESPAEMLHQVTQIVDQIKELTTQANLMAASAILAGLRLEEDVIYRLVRRDIMQESVIYRSIQKDEKRAIALNLLRGGVDINLIASSTGLLVEEVRQLQQQISSETSQIST